MRSRRGAITGLIGCLLAVAVVAAAPVTVEAAGGMGHGPTFHAAVELLQRSVEPARDGRHHDMLRALRHLRDPALVPLFEALAEHEDPLIKTHGILGLAECSPRHPIDTDRVLAINRIDLQVELLSAAMENRLMGNEQARQMLADPRVDLAVKVMLAGYLIRDGQLTDTSFLRDATEQSHLPRAAIAATMLKQLQDPTAAERLARIEDRVSPRGRDMLRQLALRTAYRFEFHRTAPWAKGLATSPEADRQTRSAALEVALRFGAEGADQLWLRRFDDADSTASRMRLGLIALRVAPWGPQPIYELLGHRPELLLAHIGQVGQAMRDREHIASAVIALARLQHPIANIWVLKYAGELAAESDAVEILESVILLLGEDAAEGRGQSDAQRLDHAATASRLLIERAPDHAIDRLRALLHTHRRDHQIVHAILAGLVRSHHPRAHQVVVGLHPVGVVASDDLRLLLLARGGQPLGPQEMAELAVLIRGGGSEQLTLRLQAAWAWLKRTHNVEPAMREVLAAR